MPVGLIANELITSSIKHAFARDTGGDIHIEVSQPTRDDIRVQVQDDGIGGVTLETLEQSVGLGSTIVRSLTRASWTAR